MRKTFCMLALLFLVVGSGVAQDAEVEIAASSVNMSFINEQLRIIADREGTSASLLRLGWGMRGEWWIGKNLGLGSHILVTAGGANIRDLKVVCYTVGLGPVFRAKMKTPWTEITFHIAGGGDWAKAEGFISGTGLGIGVGVTVKWALFSWDWIDIKLGLGANYLPIKSLNTNGEITAPAGESVLDFSGFLSQ